MRYRGVLGACNPVHTGLQAGGSTAPPPCSAGPSAGAAGGRGRRGRATGPALRGPQRPGPGRSAGPAAGPPRRCPSGPGASKCPGKVRATGPASAARRTTGAMSTATNATAQRSSQMRWYPLCGNAAMQEYKPRK